MIEGRRFWLTPEQLGNASRGVSFVLGLGSAGLSLFETELSGSFGGVTQSVVRIVELFARSRTNDAGYLFAITQKDERRPKRHRKGATQGLALSVFFPTILDAWVRSTGALDERTCCAADPTPAGAEFQNQRPSLISKLLARGHDQIVDLLERLARKSCAPEHWPRSTARRITSPPSTPSRRVREVELTRCDTAATPHRVLTAPPVDLPAIRRTLRWSTFDGCAHAVMLGVSESYLGAFAVELGHQDTALAVLSTLPPLCGALSQLLAPMLAQLVGSRRRLVVLGACLQALAHIAFIAVALSEHRGLALLLLAKIGFWVSGMVIAPAWNSWMGSLTEHVERARYFMARTTACHLFLLVGFMGAGTYLQTQTKTGVLFGYAMLFAVGLVARGLGAMALAFHIDLEPPPSQARTAWVRLRQAARTGPWKLAFAIGLLQFGAHVSVPFFTPYMLRTLALNIDTYALLTSVTIVTKVVCLPLWGALGRRVGLAPVMAASIATIALVPAAWVVAVSYTDLVLVQVLGGLGWAGFEFASLQLLLGGAPKDTSVEFFSLSSSLTGALQMAGSLSGSALLSWGADYHAVFLASSVLRFVPLLLLVPTARSLGQGLRLQRLWLRLVSVRPGGGVIRRPVISSGTEVESSLAADSKRVSD